MKYILFGTGDYYQRFKDWFVDKEIIALLDNDKYKQGTLIDGHVVIAPSELKEYEYDCIVIMSFYVSDIKKQLKSLGVEEGKIYHFFDIHELVVNTQKYRTKKRVLLLTHDLSLGGPALALLKAAKVLIDNQFDTYIGSMLNGPLMENIIELKIPIIVDRRLQISTMNELPWTKNYDLIICNTINYHVFLSDRDTKIPVIWWLHDARRYYDGIRKEKLETLDTKNLRILSVGPIPASAINEFLPDIHIDSLLYGVAENE